MHAQPFRFLLYMSTHTAYIHYSSARFTPWCACSTRTLFHLNCRARRVNFAHMYTCADFPLIDNESCNKKFTIFFFVIIIILILRISISTASSTNAERDNIIVYVIGASLAILHILCRTVIAKCNKHIACTVPMCHPMDTCTRALLPFRVLSNNLFASPTDSAKNKNNYLIIKKTKKDHNILNLTERKRTSVA